METKNTTSLGLRLASMVLPEEQRQMAWSAFERLGLPTTRHEEYKYTPITRELEKIKSWSSSTQTNLESSVVAGLGIPQITGQRVVLVNGKLDAVLSSIKPDSGYSVRSLATANPESLGTIHDFTKDAFGALNTATWTDGVYLHVSQGVAVPEPITILHLQDAREGNTMAHTRLFVHVEAGGEATVIHQTHTLGNHHAFHTVVDEVVIGNGGRFNYYKLQNDAGKSLEVWNSTIRQADDSHVDTFTLTAGGEVVRNNFQIEINGERCESHFHGLYLLHGRTLADNHTVVDHQKPNSFSNELYKGILDDRSKGVFNGKIFVRPHAQKTNAYQSNRNMLLSDAASVNTKPQLEIWADDVKCSHGCTTGQLDEEALFYLRSRGLANETAKAMLLYAFAAETMDTIKNPVMKHYISDLVGQRLQKNF